MGNLCRDCSKEVEFDLEISQDPECNLDDPLVIEHFRVYQKNINEIKRNIAGKTFDQSIKYICTFLDIPLKDLDLDSGVSAKTIQRYVSDSKKSHDKRKTVAILRTLSLPWEIVEILLKQAGITFVPLNAEDDALYAALTLFRRRDYREVNAFLVALGYQPLVKD